MANKLSFAVAINLLTENFKRGSNELKNGLRNIQMQAMTMFAAFGAGSIGLGSFVSNLLSTARETSRVSTALKNVSGDAINYGKNQQFLIDLSKKYGLYINDLVGNFAGFTASANASNMSMLDQQKIFEALSRAAVGFGMSSEQSNGMFLAVQQMMSKGKVSAEELRGQLGERLPIAMQAMAKAAGVSISKLGDLMKEGKILSADVLPKFADALNSMLPEINTDNIETSLNRMKNSFKELTDKLNASSIYKSFIDQTNIAFQWVMNNLKTVGAVFVNLITTVIISKGLKLVFSAYKALTIAAEREYRKQAIAAGVAFDRAAFAANKFGLTLKFALTSAFKAFLPLAIISGITAIIQKIVDYNNKQKELKAIWTDYQKEIKNAGGTSEEITKMQSLLRVMNSKTESQKNINKAQSELMGMLGLEKASQTEINNAVKKRIELLKETARAQLYSSTVVNSEKKIDDLAGSVGMSTEQIQRLVSSYIRNGVNKNGLGNKGASQFQYDISKEFGGRGGYDLSAIIDVVKNVAALNAVVKDANKHLDSSITKINNNENSNNNNNDDTEKPKKLTDLQQAEKNYGDTLKEYNNQLKNGVIKQADYNENVDKLNKETYLKIGGLLDPEKAKNNSVFNSAKKGVENPLVNEVNQKFIDEQTKYNKSLSLLNKQKELGLIDDEKYNDELSNLIDSTVDSIISIEKIGAGADEYLKALISSKTTLKNTKKDLSKYDYQSPFDIIGKSEKEVAEINLNKAKKELDELKEKASKTTDDLTKELNEKLSNVTTLDKALNLIQIKESIKDLQKELNGGLYSGVKDIASSAQRLFESFKNVGDTINDVDSTGWEKFLSIWNALTNSIDSIMSVVGIIQNLLEITNKLTTAKEAQTAIEAVAAGASVTNAGVETAAITAKAAVEVAAAKTVAGAYAGQMAAATTAAYAPLMLAGVPLATAQIAGYEAMILAASIPKFETGGIVGGNSLTGDKILARVNSGEMILNKKQQNTLFNQLNGNGSINNNSGGSVEFKIDGKVLKGVLENFDKIKSKTK